MFSLIIPCHSKDLGTIYGVVNSFIKTDSDLIKQIIIIFNGDKEKVNDVVNKIKGLISKTIRFDYKIFEEQLNPGIARYESYDLIKSEYVAFHDADDEPHPMKLQIINNIFKKKNPDMIYHLYQPIIFPFLKYQLNKIKYDWVDNNIAKKYIDKKFIALYKYYKGPVTHGLFAIKTDKLIKIKWSNLKSGEDREFLTKCINNNYSIIIVDAHLSKYDKFSEKRFKMNHFKHYKLFKI
jgi:glycosyltransferase involved in cell wall biosynthesis